MTYDRNTVSQHVQERTSAWIWLGGAMIAGSAIYIARREAQLARQARGGSAGAD